MGDPVRSRLLFAIADAVEGASVRQVAGKIGESQRKVRYHLDRLVEQGLVTVAREIKRRGVVERYYRLAVPTLIPSREIEALDVDESRKISLQILKAILADAGAAASAGMFGTREGHATLRVPGEVDDQGWEELAALYLHMLSTVQGIMASSRTRLAAETGNVPIRAIAAFLLFEVPRWPG